MHYKRFKIRGLAFKLSLSILSGTSLLIFIILFYNYHVSKRLLRESAQETAKQLTNATVSRIENVFVSVQKAPEGMVFYLQNPGIKEEAISEMQSISLKNKPEIFGNCVAFAPYSFSPDREGYAPYYYRTPDGFGFKNLADESYKYFNWDWYFLAEEEGRPVWTEPYFDKGGGNILMSTYAVPFFKGDNVNKAFRGVVTADLSLSWLEDLINSIKIFETGYAFLVSDRGTIITHPVKEYQMKNLGELIDKLGDPGMLDNIFRMMQSNEGNLPFHSNLNHKKCLVFFSTLPQTHWHMAIVIAEDELFAGLQRLFISTIFIGILGLLLLAAVVILISSKITRPLRKLTLTADEIGAGNFDVNIAEDRSTREISLLGNALGRMQLELKDYIRDLEITTTAKERFESELNIAHDIQQGMIPKIFPPFPNREDIDIYALLEPARQVGGDLYDFFFLDDETLCFAIGDVSDKGVPASLMMAITITLLRANTDMNKEINKIVDSMNGDICRGNENQMFVTFFMGILNMRTGEIKYCNAGHNYPLLLRKDGILETLEETHGIPLGIDKGQVYKAGEAKLERGDNLILFTDGINEATSIDGDFYGDDRLEELIRSRCKGLTTRQITEEIMEDVTGFTKTPEQSDDITLMVISYYPANNTGIISPTISVSR
jgi:phosphoserine phosphatase RsbU/P